MQEEGGKKKEAINAKAIQNIAQEVPYFLNLGRYLSQFSFASAGFFASSLLIIRVYKEAILTHVT